MEESDAPLPTFNPYVLVAHESILVDKVAW